MSKTSCEIVFEKDDTNNVFYASEIIKGNVIITLHNEKIIKGMETIYIYSYMKLWLYK